MKKLIKELLKREWNFELTRTENGVCDGGDYHLHMYLGNTERDIYNDSQAKELLAEIKKHW